MVTMSVRLASECFFKEQVCGYFLKFQLSFTFCIKYFLSGLVWMRWYAQNAGQISSGEPLIWKISSCYYNQPSHHTRRKSFRVFWWINLQINVYIGKLLFANIHMSNIMCTLPGRCCSFGLLGWVNTRVFHENMFFQKKISATHHASAWGLVWKDPKGFLILTKFRGS